MADTRGQALPSFANRVFSHPAVKIVAPLLIACIATFVLQRIASEVKWSDVKADIASVPKTNLLMAVLTTTLSFSAISLFDVFALDNFAKGKVPPKVAAITGEDDVSFASLPFTVSFLPVMMLANTLAGTLSAARCTYATFIKSSLNAAPSTIFEYSAARGLDLKAAFIDQHVPIDVKTPSTQFMCATYLPSARQRDRPQTGPRRRPWVST